MDTARYAQMIETGIEGANATVTGNGGKFEAVVVSDAFDGLNTIRKHQLVYKIFNAELASGEIHALTIKAYTPSEWTALQET